MAEPESDVSSSASSSSSGSVGKDEEQLDESSVPVPLTVKSGENAAASLGDAVGEDVELWLMRVPTHSVLRAELFGKEISLDDGRTQDDLNGVVRGNYYFADAHLSEAAKALRPLLATDGPDGPVFKIGPAFSRQVDVIFRPSFEPAGMTAPARDYPLDPENLSVKYKPIGSHAGTTMYAACPYSVN
jgi:hypothetical protein